MTALCSLLLQNARVKSFGKVINILPCMIRDLMLNTGISYLLFPPANTHGLTADLLLWLRRYLSNAGKINIKNTFLTSLYGGKCTFSDV